LIVIFFADEWLNSWEGAVFVLGGILVDRQHMGLVMKSIKRMAAKMTIAPVIVIMMLVLLRMI
jgi:hypothetical protein